MEILFCKITIKESQNKFLDVVLITSLMKPVGLDLLYSTFVTLNDTTSVVSRRTGIVLETFLKVILCPVTEKWIPGNDLGDFLPS